MCDGPICLSEVTKEKVIWARDLYEMNMTSVRNFVDGNNTSF